MSNFISGYFPITVADTTITKTDTYSYYACKIYVYGIVLSEYVILRVCFAYKKNGTLDNVNSNDGQYSYMNKYVKLTGADYDKWGIDDAYITEYVQTNIAEILASTYIPVQNEYTYIETYL